MVPSTRADFRRDLICLIVLLLAWGGLWVPRLHGPINYRWDASVYYILGTALAEGKGYRLLNEPREIQAVQYPPLLPLIVALHQRILGTSDYFKVGCALRFTYCIVSGLFLLMTYVLARRFLSPVYALLVGIISALSFSSFLEPSDVLYAEMPFAVVATGFLICQQRNDRKIATVASGILAAAAYLLRTAGITLFLAWIVQALIQRQWRQAVVRASISTLPLLLWQSYVSGVTCSYNYRHPAYSYQRADYYYPNVTYGQNSSLLDPFRPELGYVGIGELAGRSVRNLAALPVAIGESTIVRTWSAPFFSRELHQALRIPLSHNSRKLVAGILYCSLFAAGLFALGGAILVATGSQWFFSLYFSATLIIVVLAPWQDQFWRYLAPMAPLTMTFFFLALFAVRRWLQSYGFKWATSAGAFVIAVPVAGILLAQGAAAAHFFASMGSVSYYDSAGRERVSRLLDYGSEWHALDPAFEWIRQNAAPNAVIATTVPHLAYLRTGHKAVLPPFERDEQTANRLLAEVPVSYIVIDRFGQPGISERYAAPAVAESPENWQLVFTAPDLKTCVYARNH